MGAYVDEGSAMFKDYHLQSEPAIEESDAAIYVHTWEDNHQRRYTSNDPDSWNRVDADDGDGELGSAIDPIPKTGGTEEFTVDATEEEIASFKNSKGEIWF